MPDSPLLARGRSRRGQKPAPFTKDVKGAAPGKLDPPGKARFVIIAFIPESIVKRQVHLAKVEEVAIRVRVQTLKGGRYLSTSPDVPGLVAEGRSVSETVEIAQSLARKIVESCRENGDPLPAIFRNGHESSAREYRVPDLMP